MPTAAAHTPAAPTSAGPGRFLSIADVVAETSLSRATIYRMVAAGAFPARIRVSANRVAWTEAAVQAWKHQRIASPPT